MNFKCLFCGKNHSVYWKIDSANFENLLVEINHDESKFKKYYEGMFLLEKRYTLMRGLVMIPTGFNESIHYKMWVIFPAKNTIPLFENYSEEKKIILEGEIYSNLDPFYKKTKGLKILGELNIFEDEIIWQVTVLQNSKLKLHQEKGLSKKEVIEFMSKLYHEKKID